MKKNYGIISKNSLIFLILFTSIAFAGPQEDNAAKNLANAVKAKFGNAQGYSNNIAKPLASGNVPLRTLDNAQEGITQIACPGTEKLFELLVNAGPTNDIIFAQIAYDSDMDGSYDTLVPVPTPISGACANGFISCNAGTWDDCTRYAWSAQGGSINFVEVLPKELGGCFCFNSSCSAGNFFSKKDQILQSLGAGIAGALAEINPRLSTAKAEIEGTVIRYYGQTIGDCAAPNGPFANWAHDEPEDFYQQSALLAQATENELNTEIADPDSYYNLITGSIAFTNAGNKSCSITRDVHYENPHIEIMDAAGYLRITYVSHDDYTRIGDTLVVGDTQIAKEDYTFGPDYGFDTIVRDYDLRNVILKHTLRVTGGCSGSNCNFVMDLTYHCPEEATEPEKTTIFNRTYGVHDLSSGYDVETNYFTIPYCSHTQEDLVNDYTENCSVLENDDNCKLKTETVFDVDDNPIVTYSNYQPTGRSPINTCKTISNTYGQSDTVCHDWWRIEREYSCTNDQAINPDISKSEAIAASLNSADGSTWTYTDSDGTHTITPSLPDNDSCVHACKIKKVDQVSQCAEMTNTSHFRTNPTNVTFIYRECQEDTCVTGPGEVIVEDCKCINNFAEAYSAMETMRQATIDMICSDGIKKDSGILH